MKKLSLGPGAFADAIQAAQEQGLPNFALVEVFKALGVTKRSGEALWPKVSGRATSILHGRNVQVVKVTRAVEWEEADNLDRNIARSLLPGIGTADPMWGFYFPNGNSDDAIWLAQRMHTSHGSGAAMSNTLAEASTRRKSGALTDAGGARAILDVFEHELLGGGDPERKALISKQIPAISKRAGGQYPLAITDGR